MKLLYKVVFAMLPAMFFSSACDIPANKTPETVLWNGEHLATVAQEIAADPGNSLYGEAYASLLRRADRALEMANPSVMDKTHVPASGDKHDYMSMGRYFWPDPDSPDGLPYVQRDGESNPELELYDRVRLGAMGGAVSDLSLAFYLGGDRKYADKALAMLRTWFLDPATRMNPNMNYAQMVPGRDGGMGRPYGIIDGYSFVKMLDGVMLLEARGAIPADDMASLRRWFADYSTWLVESDHGKKESRGANNHSIAYDVQLLRFCLFAGKNDTARGVIDRFSAERLQAQIRPDGSQPEELRRTKAYWYSVYNIDHMLDVCDMARTLNIDLFHTAGADGSGSIEQAIRFLAEWIGRPDEWPYKQIEDWEGAERLVIRSILRASKYSPDSDLAELYARHRLPEREDGMFILLNR
jgi:hypothetical protein